MMKQVDESPLIELCSWCEKALKSLDFVPQSVCKACYTLLHRANISDQEIFGETGKSKAWLDNRPSVKR